MKLEIPVKAGEKGPPVRCRDQSGDRAGHRAAGRRVDRHDIRLREPIKTLGEHRADVHLIPGVDATVTVSVVAAPA